MQIPTGLSWLVIFAFVLLATVGGFYFTTKAVQLGEAGKVQIIETGDPLFATRLLLCFFKNGWDFLVMLVHC